MNTKIRLLYIMSTRHLDLGTNKLKVKGQKNENQKKAGVEYSYQTKETF